MSKHRKKRPKPPEPDFELIGWLWGDPKDAAEQREQMHRAWHFEHPERKCERE